MFPFLQQVPFLFQNRLNMKRFKKIAKFIAEINPENPYRVLASSIPYERPVTYFKRKGPFGP